MSSSQSSLEMWRKSGKSTGKKQKQRRSVAKPPRRLSWPASLSSQNSNSSSNNENSRRKSEGDKVNKSSKKRARFASSTERPSKYKKSNDSSSVLWVQKYTPKSSADLCVAPKKVKEIQAWVEQACDRKNYISGNCYGMAAPKKLLVMVGSPGVGKSTCVRVLAQEMGLSIMAWNESFTPWSGGGSTIFAVEQTSALDSFHEFLQQSGSGLSSLDMNDDDDTKKTKAKQAHSVNSKSLILLEELPNLHGFAAEQKFRAMMKEHLQRSNLPTVLIFSDVSEGKHKPEDLERLIDPEDLYDNTRTTILQIHGVTKPKMKKVLNAIAKQEKCSLSPAYTEELHSHSHGDLRHAIMTLQLQASGSKIPSVSALTHGTNERDKKLSTFHSLGKILYAKRKMENGVSRFAFNPDNALERSDMGLQGSLRFLEYHSVDFFTDITDVSKAFEYFSDSIELMDRSASTVGDFNGYAATVAGRAVAIANKNPAANRFRQFSRPKVFDVIRNGKQNKIYLDQLRRRLSTHQGALSNSIGGDVGTFVAESMPFVRTILPQEVDPLVNNLYSVAMSRYQSCNAQESQEEDDSALKEQEEILGVDDIQDFDSDTD